MEHKPPSPHWDNPLPAKHYLENLTQEQIAELRIREHAYFKAVAEYSNEKTQFGLSFTKKYLYGTLCDRFSNFICDKEDARVFRLLSLYFSNSPEFESEIMSNGKVGNLSKGIYLTGNVGIGKTELLLAFRKMVPGYPFNYFQNGYEIYATAHQIASAYDRQGDDGIVQYINAKTLLIDDLGREPQSKHYGKSVEALELVFAARYDLGKRNKVVTHVTTNITDADLIEERYGDYIRNRFVEIFNKIHWNGTDKRK